MRFQISRTQRAKAAFNRFLDIIAHPWMSRLTDEQYFSITTRRAGLMLFLKG